MLVRPSWKCRRLELLVAGRARVESHAASNLASLVSPSASLQGDSPLYSASSPHFFTTGRDFTHSSTFKIRLGEKVHTEEYLRIFRDKVIPEV